MFWKIIVNYPQNLLQMSIEYESSITARCPWCRKFLFWLYSRILLWVCIYMVSNWNFTAIGVQLSEEIMYTGLIGNQGSSIK